MCRQSTLFSRKSAATALRPLTDQMRHTRFTESDLLSLKLKDCRRETHLPLWPNSVGGQSWHPAVITTENKGKCASMTFFGSHRNLWICFSLSLKYFSCGQLLECLAKYVFFIHFVLPLLGTCQMQQTTGWNQIKRLIRLHLLGVKFKCESSTSVPAS